MSSVTSEREESPRTTARTESVETQWLTLQRAVAAGMIVVLALPMVYLQQIVPPLAVVGGLFVVALASTWLRPRAAAIGIGVLAGGWFILQLINISKVIVDITQPSETLFFMITLGMLVGPIAGVVGLVGVVRRAHGRIAVRTLQAAGIVLLGSLALSLLAGL